MKKVILKWGSKIIPNKVACSIFQKNKDNSSLEEVSFAAFFMKNNLVFELKECQNSQNIFYILIVFAYYKKTTFPLFYYIKFFVHFLGQLSIFNATR